MHGSSAWGFALGVRPLGWGSGLAVGSVEFCFFCGVLRHGFRCSPFVWGAGACGGACGVFVRGWGAVLLLLPVWVVVGMLTSGDGKCVVLGVFAFAFFQEGAWGCAC
jgi:hypothetical protein